MKLSLNKNAMKQQRDQLAMYRRFLPSLDMKRQQLLGAWKAARQQLEQTEQAVEEYWQSLKRLLPLLGSTTLADRDLSPLVRLRKLELDEENIAGARVPTVRAIEFERTAYSTLTLPFWVDQLVESLEAMARLRIQLQVDQTRAERLATAARKITQRVNLFEKVLIPQAQQNIKRIAIALSDEERSSVVRSKLAKARRSQGR